MKNLIGLILMGACFLLLTTQCTDAQTEEATPPVTQEAEATPVKTDAAPPKAQTVSPQTGEAGEMPWASLGNVEDLMKKEPKKMIVDVYTPWCGPCKMMDRNTFSNPEIIDLVSTNFHPVKFNAEGPDPITYRGKEYSNPQFDPNRRGRNAKHQLASLFPVRGYPSLLVVNEQFEIVGSIVGYRTPEQLKEELAPYMN